MCKMQAIFNSFQFKGIFESEPVKAKTSEPPNVGSALTEPDSSNVNQLKRIKVPRNKYMTQFIEYNPKRSVEFRIRELCRCPQPN